MACHVRGMTVQSKRASVFDTWDCSSCSDLSARQRPGTCRVVVVSGRKPTRRALTGEAVPANASGGGTPVAPPKLYLLPALADDLADDLAAVGAAVGRFLIQQMAAGRSTARLSLSSHTCRTTLSVKSVPEYPTRRTRLSRTPTLPNSVPPATRTATTIGHQLAKIDLPSRGSAFPNSIRSRQRRSTFTDVRHRCRARGAFAWVSFPPARRWFWPA